MNMLALKRRLGAACRGRLDLDFIEPTPAEATECRRLCASCPLRERCLTEALTAGEPWGIWGGLDPNEREYVAEQYGYPIPSVLPVHATNSRYTKHGCRCRPCREAHTAYERARRSRQHRQ